MVNEMSNPDSTVVSPNNSIPVLEVLRKNLAVDTWAQVRAIIKNNQCTSGNRCESWKAKSLGLLIWSVSPETMTAIRLINIETYIITPVNRRIIWAADSATVTRTRAGGWDPRNSIEVSNAILNGIIISVAPLADSYVAKNTGPWKAELPWKHRTQGWSFGEVEIAFPVGVDS